MKQLFFPDTITDWNDLDYSVRNAPSISVFRQDILNFTCLATNKVFMIYNPHDLKVLARLCLGLNHLQGHQFKHNFSGCLFEICIF